MNSHLLSQFFNVEEAHLLAAADPFAPHQMWQHPHQSVYVKTEDSGDDASSNASWGFTSPMDYDPASPATTINCIPGGLAQISLPGSSRSPSPDMTLTLPGAFNFAAAAHQPHPSHPATHPKPVTAIPAHLRANAALNPSSLVSPSVIPTPLQTAQSSPKSNGRAAKVNTAPLSTAPSTAPSSPTMEHNLQLINGQPHPYSISPSNTTALFTRASSVVSNPSAKKGRAPPSGPISTKDFIPPDVSGLSKREARLVKNRAAAFLSRQRKREEFEGLEARVEVLEADNARLYKELESYRSGAPTSSPSTTATTSSGATPAALQAEVIGLRRQLSARDQELSKLHGRMQALNADANAERERSAQKDAEIAQLKRMLEQSKTAPTAPAAAAEEDSDSDSEDAQSVAGDDESKKDVRSAGSMAFMVLLFSLSSLLTSAESSSSSKPAERVRRPGMHHRDSSRTYLDLPVQQQQFASGLSYDSFLSTSDASSMMLGAPAFFEEDNLLGGSSAFAGLGGRPQQHRKESAIADSLTSAISSVKSISPQEFEFDFTVPESAESSSLDSFTFPAKKQTAATEGGKKIRVCVKSALPLNLNLDALSKAAGSSAAPQSAPAPAASSMAMTNDLFASSFGYRVPETDDLLLNSGLWSTSPTVASASPTAGMMMSPESRKRKRVVVEINPRGAQRRRLSSDVTLAGGDADTWDVKFSSEDGALFDEDVQMRL